MKKDGLIYLAIPYTHESSEVEEYRFNVACKVSARLLRAGYKVYCPIVHSHPIAKVGDLPTNWDFWAKYDKEFLKKCDYLYVIMVDGWDKSRGVKGEMEFWDAWGDTEIKFIAPLPEELS